MSRRSPNDRDDSTRAAPRRSCRGCSSWRFRIAAAARPGRPASSGSAGSLLRLHVFRLGRPS